MKVLVTGTEGYLGSLLPPLLMERGHEVLGVDTGFYKAGWLFNGTDVTAKTLNKDIRNITLKDLQGVDAIVHMAELSNDPTGQLSPTITYDINHHGSVRLAKLAKEAGIRRFVYMSSCSVYGVATEGDVTEESPVNPQTAYAECKTLVERDVMQLADDDFSPTFMRNATAFGASPRMRFDIVLNNLAGLAWTSKEIKMTSDGTPWRPLVHALDICKAIVCALEAPRDIVHRQIFNVGDTANNYRVREIAEIIADVFTGCQLSFGDNGADNRSYRVSFEKINTMLPGFKCDWNAQLGAEQLFKLFSQIDMTEDTFLFRGFTRLKQLEYLIRTQQIDKDFFWQKN
ncbi:MULTISPECIES: NAD-dependent epimerase/dehydratase family protein [unclassified Tolypothrix]|uniref:NAD-dependent epimerase/dehydratase family protein n=1 Tax=unclassified Tolypothrix TaxID=2649714 RepID=UPI0005EAAC0D|nr:MULTISPECIES: SDR family oxidoreductase [unclassified Tolypothrix]BAY92322.1 NAD-dependent epimerase/dehydratase [Microchaete diplosiphon NIES-3275]EKE98399.1 NAD dependent epimerase/dehydratase family protein [Tolypothrix sp. PCC 7601]MBE9085497.1 SDR family oxidoreductase [Tolypothrix sp. LEGE 11397]UYD26292.1 SDR family oxidoreductase [Tolypothrix sp. PCC 7712]UYD31471.1 SDR family oxidoreductase [Tolypothrix sp. PCC 7601]